MSNLEKYNKIFCELFNIDETELVHLKYQQGRWDSVGHMTLVASLEEAFDIMMDTDDIIDFASYKIGIEILKKYEVIL